MTQPPNKIRRACIVIGALTVSAIGLIYLNTLPIDDVTLINQRSAEGLLDIFLSTIGLYVFGSVSPSVVEAYAKHNKAKVTNNYVGAKDFVKDELTDEDEVARG